MDKKQGFGVYMWADGRKYEGSWEKGKQHGNGKVIGLDGKEQEGVWQSGKKVK